MNAPTAGAATAGRVTPAATGEYEPLVWQIITGKQGYVSLHETDEDGNPGDLIAQVCNHDHLKLLAAAPDLLSALQSAVGAMEVLGHPKNYGALLKAQNAIAKATTRA